MFSKLKNQQKGFTIIEVLIVLAIVGLIMLVVFLAVPALQRNSRNTQRKADVSNILGAFSEYAGNNNGQYPANTAALTGITNLGFYNEATEVQFTANSGAALGAGRNNSFVYVRTGAKCNNNDFTATNASSRTVAIVYTLETSGGVQAVCQES